MSVEPISQSVREDQEDLAAFEERAAEATLTFEDLLACLKVDLDR